MRRKNDACLGLVDGMSVAFQGGYWALRLRINYLFVYLSSTINAESSFPQLSSQIIAIQRVSKCEVYKVAV